MCQEKSASERIMNVIENIALVFVVLAVYAICPPLGVLLIGVWVLTAVASFVSAIGLAIMANKLANVFVEDAE